MINPRAPEPPYRQLAAILRGMIEHGQLKPGEPLPSEAELQETYEVSRGTVRRAMKVLRDEGAAYTVGGRGTYVSEPPK